MSSLAQQAAQPDWKLWVVPIAAAVIAAAVLAIGWQDVGRFRFRRVRAIAGVCFAESIRRRILWVIPLAIVGVVAVTQLTRPLDALDAVRQTTKYSIFATGLIVVVAAVILACTNLPKEIESRVIFTIVTKPTTRLEIVLGKVLGFAGISALILVIMGGFTFAYLEARAWSLGRQVRQALAAGKVTDPAERARLQEYADRGLLGTKAVRWPTDLQVYGREPSPDGTRWIVGGQSTYMVVPFALTPQDRDKVLNAAAAAKAAGDDAAVALIATLNVDVRKVTSQADRDELARGEHPMGEGDTFGPALPTTGPALPLPRVTMTAQSRQTGKPVAAADLAGQNLIAAQRDRRWQPGGARTFVVPLSGASADELLEAGRFNVEVTGATPTLEYGAGPTPMQLVVISRNAGVVAAVPSSATEPVESPAVAAADAEARGDPRPGVRFYSRFGRVGMQIEGRPPEEGLGAVAVYSFRGATDVTPAADGKIALQTKINIDRGGDLDAERFKTSVAAVTVRNLKTGRTTDPILIEPDIGRLLDVRVPADALDGGDFDVAIRGLTPGQHLGLHGLSASVPSVALVQAEHPFALNLVKALLVLWMLSTLVVTIAVFTSTFLSWPIAVVLTVLLLLGRWGVDQLGESLNPGAARNVAQDLFKVRDATQTQVVTGTMEGLSAVLRNVAPVLPDVNRFPVVEDLDRGVSIPAAKVARAGQELLVYGIPLVLLTYFILRRKEVAP